MSINLKVKVTKEILEETKMCGISDIPHTPESNVENIMENCAIAVAVRGVLGKVQVGEFNIDFFENVDGKDTHICCIELPDAASDFIQEFDRNLPEARVNMPELEFEIEVPDIIINKIGDMEEVRDLISSSKTLELV